MRERIKLFVLYLKRCFMKTSSPAKNINDYLKGFPPEAKTKLEQLRSIIQKAAPGSEECISYGIPTFKLNGNLVHFGGFKNHLGFYPTPTGIKEFEKELSV